MTERKLAVFDVDGTIRPGSLVEDAFWQLTESGLLTPSKETIEQLISLRDLKDHGYIWALVEAYAEAKKGVKVADIRRFAKQMAQDSIATLYPEVMARIEQHKQAGDLLAMISGSPQVHVEALAAQLGFNAASGSRFYHNGHRYHSQRIAEDRGTREQKPIIAQNIANRLGATGIVAAYGDTMTDVDMLELAEHPVAVHPTAELRTHAITHGWEVID